MKRILIIATSFGVALAIGCGQPKKSDKNVTTRAGDPGRPEQGFPSGANQAGSTWGAVIPMATTINFTGGTPRQTTIHDTVRWFLSTDFPNNKVGGISTSPVDTLNMTCGSSGPQGPYNTSCGIGISAINGSGQSVIRFRNGLTFNEAISNNQQNFIESGTVTLLVWDALSGTRSPTGQTYSSIPVIIPILQNSYVSGACQPTICRPGEQNDVKLFLGDNYGTVTIEGRVTGNRLDANISFANLQNKEPSVGNASGQLGQVQANVCTLFPCR